MRLLEFGTCIRGHDRDRAPLPGLLVMIWQRHDLEVVVRLFLRIRISKMAHSTREVAQRTCMI